MDIEKEIEKIKLRLSLLEIAIGNLKIEELIDKFFEEISETRKA